MTQLLRLKVLKNQKQPNKWSCLPTAFAIVADIPIDIFIGVIGHDGSEILYPEYELPRNRRAFHYQECFLALERLGWWASSYEQYPMSGPEEHGPYHRGYIDLNYLMSRYNGVIIANWINNLSHAVAWDAGERLIYDPTPPCCHDRMPNNIDTFFPMIKVK